MFTFGIQYYYYYYKKLSYHRGLQQVNDLEGHSRSSELLLFDWPYITSY